MIEEKIDRQCELLGSNTEPVLQLLFSLKPEYDRNRYNVWRSNEVAAVFHITADGGILDSYVNIWNKDIRVLQYSTLRYMWSK